VTYSSYLIEATTWIKSYIHLGTYANEDLSAWTKVWICIGPATAPISAPGGRDLEDFCDSGRAGDI